MPRAWGENRKRQYEPTVVHERERKFDLDPGRRLPELTVAGPVATQRGPLALRLDATYFDTEDARLLRAGITLRKRTGGTDAGWHLKLPAGSGARDEVQLPTDAADSGVPRELTERVRSHVDPDGLIEIAHLHTERCQYDLLDTRGKALAVLTDDTVTGEVAGRVAHLDGWRELEIELDPAAPSGLLDTLGDALTRAGARPAHWSSKLRRLLADILPARTDVDRGSTAGEVTVAYLRTQVDALRRHDIGVRRDADDAIHQLRVAMRRLRSVLTGFRGVLDRDRTRDLTAELKWAGRALSDARDAEVLRDLITEELSAVAEVSGVDGARRILSRHVGDMVTKSRGTVHDVLTSPRYAALLGTLETLVDQPPLTPRAERPARSELRRAITRADRRLAEAVDALDDLAPGPDLDAGLHEVRKKAKQARYAADTVRPAFGRRLRTWRTSVKAIQTTLGDHHDLVEARALLSHATESDGVDAPAAFVLGILHEQARAHGAALHERFSRQWPQMPPPP